MSEEDKIVQEYIRLKTGTDQVTYVTEFEEGLLFYWFKRNSEEWKFKLEKNFNMSKIIQYNRKKKLERCRN